MVFKRKKWIQNFEKKKQQHTLKNKTKTKAAHHIFKIGMKEKSMKNDSPWRDLKGRD